jgi:2,4-dienoyl-CoA reductase (NADPH2)
MSVLELVEGGWNLAEAQAFAVALESAGVDIINTGIGWHEATIPTIAMSVPRAAFSWATAKIKEVVNIPVAASNRINTADVAEQIIQRGDADMVYMSRPFLADPDFVSKAQQGQTDEINTCIACNQSCLDNIFAFKTASCLVNPRACHETIYAKDPTTTTPKKFAVIGAGAAGLSFSITAAKHGHTVTLYESKTTIGGQMLLARKVPGKQEFDELLRYFKVMLEKHKVNVHLNTTVDADMLKAGDYDAVVLASGIKPRLLSIPGADRDNVLSYEQALLMPEKIGPRVVIIGAGGIGFDIAEFVCHTPTNVDPIQAFNQSWGIDAQGESAGALLNDAGSTHLSQRDVTLLQRKEGKFGRSLGKTTGWIHQKELQKFGVKLLGGLDYIRIDEQGLYIQRDGEEQLLPADTIIVCAGQESRDTLAASLEESAKKLYRIGGVKQVKELDAAQAISDGVQLAYTLTNCTTQNTS